jgi:hypothetical protein
MILPEDHFILSALTMKFIIFNSIFFPSHFISFKEGISGVSEFLLTKNFVYSFLTSRNIIYNIEGYESVGNILTE